MRVTLSDLLRQSVYSRLAGYEDLNDGRTTGSGQFPVLGCCANDRFAILLPERTDDRNNLNGFWTSSRNDHYFQGCAALGVT
jgi:hypothetical protein